MEPPFEKAREANVGPGPEAPSRRRWILAGSVGAVVFLIFESVTPFVAVPLREISSILAQVLLQAIGFPVSRAGTILSTPRATFDVVPACSGSTTLQVLLFLSIVWCGVHPRLTPGRRVLAILLAVPLAILANALRVSALVAAGHAVGGEPHSFAHVGAGLVAFVLAMAGCFAITQRFASATIGPGVRDRTLAWILGGLLAFLSLPFLTWCLENWGGGSLDRYGQVFTAAAVAVAVWKWRSAPADRSREVAGTVGAGISFLGLAAATLMDVNILKGLCLLLAFLSLGLALKGPRFAASMVPVALLAYLGFPSVSYQLGVLTSWRFVGLPAFFVMKSVAALILLAILAAPGFRSASEFTAPGRRRLLPLQLLMAALLAAFQTYCYGFAGTGLQESRLEMSYLQGPWVGADVEPPQSEADFFGRDRIWSRRFMRDGGIVDVLVTSTGGDRHRAHPPAYCVTGNGWRTVESEVTERRLGTGSGVPMTRLRLRKGDQDMLFCYWFTNGSEFRAGFSGMLLHDTVRRLGGRRSDWFVFRVMTASGDAALDSFLSDFQARLAPRTAETAGSPGGPR